MSRRSILYTIPLAILVLFAQACSMPGTGTPTPTASGPLTLYVSTTGNDANNCQSLATACQTLYRAISYVAMPGSTIHIGPGRFDNYTSWEPRFSLNLVGAGVDSTTLVANGGDVLQLAYPGNFDIRDLSIVGTNPATGGGNGIEVRAGVTLTLENCHISGKYWGLRLFAEATATASNCSFTGNYYGVANFGNLVMSASTFTTNQVAMDNQGVAQVQTTDFDRNGSFDTTSFAASPTISTEGSGRLTIAGGSLSNSRGYGLVLDGGSALLDGVDVHDNAGMAVWQQQGTLEIRSSQIRDNGSYGLAVGGLTGVTSVGFAYIHETAIVRNGTAGVHLDGGTVLLQNVTVSGNRTGSTGGGGIWIDGGGLLLLDSTVAFNTGHGIQAGPGEFPASILARRSVVALNSAQQCQVDSRVSTSYDHPTFMCNESFTAASLGLGPLTSQAGTLVHPLLSGSPLIDAGGPVGLCGSIDQRHYVRPAGATCDVGAYEWNAVPALVYVPPITTLLPLRPTDTPAPTVLAASRATDTGPAATVAQVIPTLNAFCRKGPGTLYDQISVLQKGTAYNVIGRNGQNTWWQIQGPDGKDCWVGDANVSRQGPVDQVSVGLAAPLPATPTKFVDSFTCDIKAKTLGVSFNWAMTAGATGYRIYRNGSQLVTVDATTTSYHDDAPLAVDLTYELEAFNLNGVAPRLSVTVPACK
ncbi:MAG TPA: right-handed parallel beta-helix repeat-containing protein [Anaerolineales bacterium]|nr:right-handed parallel beta-helix repeat-containing protein [Anaerolineales bacterium]